MILPLPGCASALNKPDTFITWVYTSDNGNLTDLYLGMTNDQMYGITGSPNNWTGIWPQFNAAGNSVSIKLDNHRDTLKSGINTNSNYADILPAYAKDKSVVVELDTQEKVILSKMINGVKYTVTFRNYPSSGDVKTITITDTSQYTENDADYQ